MSHCDGYSDNDYAAPKDVGQRLIDTKSQDWTLGLEGFDKLNQEDPDSSSDGVSLIKNQESDDQEEKPVVMQKKEVKKDEPKMLSYLQDMSFAEPAFLRRFRRKYQLVHAVGVCIIVVLLMLLLYSFCMDVIKKKSTVQSQAIGNA